MTSLSPEILDAVAHGSHHDPHSVLGVHETGDGWVIRSRRPLAATVVAELADGTPVPLEHVRGGIWEAAVDAFPGPTWYVRRTTGRSMRPMTAIATPPPSASSTCTSSPRDVTRSCGACSERTSANSTGPRAPPSPCGRPTPVRCA